MISVSRLSDPAAAAAYYLDREPNSDYYTAPEEARGRWLGQGSEHLGLVGALDERGGQAFAGLLRGTSPDGTSRGKPVLRVRPAARVPVGPLLEALQGGPAELLKGQPWWETYQGLLRQVDRRGISPVTVRADAARVMSRAARLDADAIYAAAGIDLADALAASKERVDVRRPGYDAVFSAPKSVSVLFALADPSTAQILRTAHATAVSDALDYLELFVARAARGHQEAGGPVSRVSSRGLIAAAFEHRASRAGDPQLHTHVVIANLLEGMDGQWNAVNSSALYQHQHTAGLIYQAVLRSEISQALKVAWGPTVKGIAELEGVPDRLRRAFSQRRVGIEAFLEAHGLSGPDAARQAALETRPPKKYESEELQRERWNREAQSVGAKIELVSAPPPVIDEADVVDALLSSNGLTKHSSTFDSRDVLQGICNELPAGAAARLPDLLELGRAVLRHSEAIPLLRALPGHDRAYSTAELLQAEAEALSIAGQITSRPSIEPVLDDGLSDEQAAAVRRLVASTGRVTVLEGPAGAGKTVALRSACSSWTAAQRPVLGGAVAAVAAHGLEKGSGIPSMSLARLLTRLEQKGLEHDSVVVIDEASMVGTRALLTLFRAAEAADAQIVLVGDPQQLSEIDAGGLFNVLSEREDTVRLLTNVRQVAVWERRALLDLRRGHPEEALDEYARHDRVRLADDREDLHARIAADYLRHRCSPGVHEVLVLASQKREVTAINARIRGYLRDSGSVGQEELTSSSGLRLSAGDEVVITRNDYSRGLFNGTRARVSAVDLESQTLLLVTREGDEHSMSVEQISETIDLAYAMTCHKAQGTTVDVALLAGTTALSREAAYVAMSRGRSANYLYATHAEIQDHECGMKHTEDHERDLGAHLGEALARSRRQRTAGSYGLGRELPYRGMPRTA